MKDQMPRVLFAAPKSGSGKTMITCGMLALCRRRQLKTAAFKCGPDYIDPMFHRKVLGVSSGNLDTFFTDQETTRYLLAEKAKESDITILEGVMGYYDGLAGKSETASTYEAARVTKTPVVLIVDGKGASVSLAAVIKGIIDYRKDSGIAGVLLNRVSAGYYDRLKELIETECGLPVLGYLPELPELQIPSRHLGLVAPEELRAFKEWTGRIADVMEKTVEVERIFLIARSAPKVEGKAPFTQKLPRKVKIALAKDEAFSFYYQENLELMEKMGAELIPFSPIHDERLPEDVDGIYLGGGYPELYGKELEAAVSMRSAVREACKGEMPVLAECGGFMYLQKTIRTGEGSTYEMAGVLDGEVLPTDKLCRFGYLEALAKKAGVFGQRAECAEDPAAGTAALTKATVAANTAAGRIRGHEFHYFDCTENGDGFRIEKPLSDRKYESMVYTNTMAAGFPHFYYYSNPEMLYQFLMKCFSYRAGRLAKKRWDEIAKPIDSLGILEDLVVRLCRIRGEETPPDIGKRALLILCGDHGVVKEGVTQTGSEVTRIVSENFAKGISTVNYMAQTAGVDVFTVDLGIDAPAYPEKELRRGAVIDRKIARGCGNIAVEPAMTREQCRQAIETGTELVRELKEMGYTIIATGEMGIGNTTPTSALAAIFLGLPVFKTTGRGAGLNEEGFQKKCRIVKQAVGRVKEKKLSDPIDLLAEAGCYEIAGMAGVFLGGLKWNVPIVIDGAISAAAAFAAQKIDRRAIDFMFPSHKSREVTGGLFLDALKLRPPVWAEMCLGEGTGAMTLFPLLDMAVEVYQKMGDFSEYQIEAYRRYEKEL